MRKQLAVLIVGVVLALSALACGGAGAGPSNEAKPPPAPVSFSGSGDEVVDVSSTTGKAYTKCTLTHDGKANFIVRPSQADGKEMMTLVIKIGVYSGTVAWDRRAASLEVRADGNWTIRIE